MKTERKNRREERENFGFSNSANEVKGGNRSFSNDNSKIHNRSRNSEGNQERTEITPRRNETIQRRPRKIDGAPKEAVCSNPQNDGNHNEANHVYINSYNSLIQMVRRLFHYKPR